MASVRNGNTIYLDSTSDTFAFSNLKVSHIVITSTGSAGHAVLADLSDTSRVKLDLCIPANTSQEFRFADQPIVFPTGIQATTLSNCVITFVTSLPGA